ncbi:MAG: T9SS type A sorting domain-containing protein [Bacteroidales bacterium]|nr:T9SS type A sorting domain-containing protein [Bacteroidales bacterium]
MPQTFIITAVTAVGMNSFNEDVQIFPNPAKDMINIVSPYNTFEIGIYNLNGQKMYDSKFNNAEGKISLDISHLSDGVYFLHIQTPQSIITHKLLIFK